MIRSMLARLWRSRLTWTASIAVTAAVCVLFLATAGIGGTPGAIIALVLILGWAVLLGKMSENEARHVASLASAKGSAIPKRHLRTLLIPWWARLLLMVGVLAVLLAAIPRFGDGLTALLFVCALGAAWLVERAVIRLRRPRD
jgi:dolichol kinase